METLFEPDSAMTDRFEKMTQLREHRRGLAVVFFTF
jgi:hypothetical protein